MNARDIALAVFVVSMWGLGFTVIKPTMEQFPPILIMAISFAATALVLMAIDRRPAATPQGAAALIALFAVSGQAALIFSALRGLEASTGVIIAQFQVPLAVLWAWLLGTEAFRPSKLGAFVLALAGVIVIAGLPAQRPDPFFVVLMTVGGAVWGLGQVLIAKLGRDDGAVLLRRVSLHGAAQLLIFTIAFESGQWTALTTASPAAWSGLAFIALVTFALAYAIWFDLMRRNAVSQVTPFIMLMPAVSVLASIVFLGERPGWPVFAGGALILAGLAISSGIVKLRGGHWRAT
ncbi:MULTISPECIES: DMT family transporter [unclassified Roseitalea]|uniref:DMT family transporter n=1 Tax=unclassified Roseitalea TaxID=2639107 RepID=UPI00273FF2DE|nr:MULTISPECIES: DMT family transporter [unclassified Roseitalea]